MASRPLESDKSLADSTQPNDGGANAPLPVEYAEHMSGSNLQFDPKAQERPAEGAIPRYDTHDAKHLAQTPLPPSYPGRPDDNHTAQPKKEIFGIRRRIFWILVVVVIIVMAAVAVGVAVPLSLKKNHSASSNDSASSSSSPTPSISVASTTASSSSSTPSSSASASPTASFDIISAFYGGADITSDAKSKLISNNDIVVDTNSMPFYDDWYNNKKCLSFLYSYGSSIRTFVACEGNGQITVAPGPIATNSYSQEITRQGPTLSDFAIVSVVWGSAEIRTSSVYSKIFNGRNSGLNVTFSNDYFGLDTLINSAKSGVIWYTEDNYTTFKSIYGREGNSSNFQ